MTKTDFAEIDYDFIFLRSGIRRIDRHAKELEEQVKSCKVKGIFYNFDDINREIKISEKEITVAVEKRPEDKQIIELKRQLFSIDKRAKFEFEKKCICTEIERKFEFESGMRTVVPS